MGDIPLLELIDVKRSFRLGASEEPALRGVSLTIRAGEFVAIMGPSGSGKSTLLNILGLLQTPSSGAYRINGNDVSELEEKARDALRASTFGFVFQASHTVNEYSAIRNVALPLSAVGVPWAERASIAADALGRVGLADKASQNALTLSGGEKQRVAIARALAIRPDILLADEPTGNLDSENSQAVVQLLHRAHEQGATIILITHDRDVAAHAQRTVEIRDGIVASAGAEYPTPHQADDGRTNARPRVGQSGRWLEVFYEALNSVTARPTRSLAIAAAFLLGAGGLVTASGVSATAAEQISTRLAEASLSEVYVHLPAETEDEEVLKASDALAAIDHVVAVGARADIPASLASTTLLPPGSVAQPTFSGFTQAVDSGYIGMAGVRTHPTAVANFLEVEGLDRVALVGSEAAAELGITEARPGSTVWVAGRRFDVVGVIAESPQNVGLSEAVIVPLRAFDHLATTLVVRTEIGLSAAVAEAIPFVLNPSNPGSVNVSTVGDLRELRLGVADDLSSLIALTGIILLVMAVLTASNSMLLAIGARTPEIALRRAIGFSRRQIVGTLMLEGSLLGLAGGLAGAVGGLGATIAIAVARSWTPVLPPLAIGIGVIAGLAAGMLATIPPAMRIARIDPAQAIRGN